MDLLALLVSCVALVQEPPPAEAPPTTWDLRLASGPAGPAVVSLELKGEMTTTFALPTGPKVVKSQRRVSRRLVDEVTAIEPGWRVTRYISRWEEDVDRSVEDPPIVGTTFELTDTEGKVAITKPDDLLMLEREWSRLTLEMQSPALLVVLPRDASLGTPFKVDDPSFLHLLLAMEGAIEQSTLELTLLSVDAEKQLATLSGKATARESVTDPLDATLEWRCDFELVADLASRRVATVKGRGTMAAKATAKGLDATIDAAFEIDGSVSADADAVAAASRKAKLRDRTFSAAAGGVSVVLPSSFFIATREPEFQLQVGPPEGLLAVGLQAFPRQGAKIDDIAAQVIATLATKVPDIGKAKGVTSALGKGKGVQFENEGNLVEVEIYPLGEERVLRLQVIGNPAVRKRFAKELSRMRATLKALQP